MFALVDCNNFYASCERVFQPRLRNQPVVILSNNDGCVIARSNEAKKLGVPMGAPAFQYKALFEAKNINVFSSNYALYGDMSNRVMQTLAAYADEMEVYSIDEAFLQIKGLSEEQLLAYSLQMRKEVSQGTGIPVSIGVAPSKSLAKVANKIAKKFPEKTGHVHIIDSDTKRIKALKWLPIEDVWGIGRRYAKKLQAQGIVTAYDFTRLPETWVKQHLSIMGLRLQQELKGKPCLELEQAESKKHITTARSFDTQYTDFKLIKERVITFATSCAKKLRKQNTVASAMMVFVHTNAHRPDLPQYAKNMVIQLPFPSNSDIELAKYAGKALEKIFKEGYAYKKAGVIVMDLKPCHQIQFNLFENSNPKHQKLMQVIDQMNDAIGVTKIKLGAQDKDRTWKMRQEKLSPRYSTRIKDVIHVKA